MSSKNSRHAAYRVARHPKTPESAQMAKVVGAHLRKLRTDLGISQEHLAEIVGVHRTQVGFLERGDNTTTIFTLASVAKAFHKKASEILYECGY